MQDPTLDDLVRRVTERLIKAAGHGQFNMGQIHAAIIGAWTDPERPANKFDLTGVGDPSIQVTVSDSPVAQAALSTELPDRGNSSFQVTVAQTELSTELDKISQPTPAPSRRGMFSRSPR